MAKVEMLDIENFDQKFTEIVQSKEWKHLQEAYNSAKNVFILGLDWPR